MNNGCISISLQIEKKKLPSFLNKTDSFLSAINNEAKHEEASIL